MAKQLNLSFKENEVELELYDWVKKKLNPGVYIKELLYMDYLVKNNSVHIVQDVSKSTQVEVQDEVEINKNFNKDEVEEF